RPRALHPGVPPALEAVCLKAMALRPEDRYPSAQALAEEIERWLADEPVLARPDPLLVRIGRWSRRHGVLVAAASSLLITATMPLSVGTVLIGRAQSQTQRQRDEAQRQRNRAEVSFRQAREAVDRYFTRVSEDTLLNEPGLQSLRKRLLEDALTYYQLFV